MAVVLRMAVLVCAAALPVLADSKIPPIAPQIQGTFPHGGQRGAQVEITIRGRNLQDTREIRFRGAGLSAQVVRSDPYRVTARVRIASDAEPGRHDLRLIAAHGSALGWFDVSTFSESLEKEPNNDREHAQPVQFPLLMNGVIPAGDYDYFRFQTRAGQTLTFDLNATRNGSPFDGVLSLLDESGEEIAYSDDYYAFKDPHLVHRFEKSGNYFLRVYGSGESGSDTSDYRLMAGEMPHVDLAMPSGGTRGQTIEVTLRGVNLGSVDSVVIGDGLVRGEVLARGFERTRVRFRLPPDLPPGEYKLHAGGAGLPVPFVVSPFPELTVTDGAARSRKDPVAVTLPVVANGIIDRPRAADYFTFRVDSPRSVTLDVESMQLGLLLDPLVIVYDENGKRIAWQDEPTTNTGKEPANMDPHLVVPLPKAGRYVAAIRDASFRGDPVFGYRLTIKHAEPDFTLRTIGADETLYRGHSNVVLVRVRRLEGWNTPVEVWADNLPAGVRCRRAIAEPKNTPYTGTCGETHYLDGTNIELRFEVDRNAPFSVSDIRIRGRGVMDGRTLDRASRARYFKSRVRLIGDSEEPDLRAVIADAPGVVLQVPVNVRLSKEGAGSLTAIVTRVDENGPPLELSLESAADGLAMEPVSVPYGVTRADIMLKASAKAPGQFVLVGTAGGTVLGKSHPVRVTQ